MSEELYKYLGDCGSLVTHRQAMDAILDRTINIDFPEINISMTVEYIMDNYFLKLCPFCNGEPLLKVNNIDPELDLLETYILCCDCGARTETIFSNNTEEEKVISRSLVVKFWNTRV